MRGETALHDATERGKLEVVKVLIAASVDLNRLDKFRYTPLQMAVHHKQEAIVELLAQQPGIDVNKRGYGLWTPLGLAKSNRSQRIADILKQNGATR